jgi:hypothetical protein
MDQDASVPSDRPETSLPIEDLFAGLDQEELKALLDPDARAIIEEGQQLHQPIDYVLDRLWRYTCGKYGYPIADA